MPGNYVSCPPPFLIVQKYYYYYFCVESFHAQYRSYFHIKKAILTLQDRIILVGKSRGYFQLTKKYHISLKYVPMWLKNQSQLF